MSSWSWAGVRNFLATRMAPRGRTPSFRSARSRACSASASLSCSELMRPCWSALVATSVSRTSFRRSGGPVADAWLTRGFYPSGGQSGAVKPTSVEISALRPKGAAGVGGKKTGAEAFASGARSRLSIRLLPELLQHAPEAVDRDLRALQGRLAVRIFLLLDGQPLGAADVIAG